MSKLHNDVADAFRHNIPFKNPYAEVVHRDDKLFLITRDGPIMCKQNETVYILVKRLSEARMKYINAILRYYNSRVTTNRNWCHLITNPGCNIAVPPTWEVSYE